MNYLIKAASLTIVLACVAECARILAVLPIPAQSHHVTLRAVLRALAEAGHHVTSYTPFPMDEPVDNYTEIQVENVWSSDEDRESLILDIKSWSYRDCFNLHYHFAYTMLDAMLKSEELQALLKSNKNYDLIIIEQLTGSEYLTVLGSLFRAPIVAVQPFMTNDILNSLTGNAITTAYFPNMCSSFSTKMTFLERLQNSHDVLRQLYTHYYKHLPKTESMMKVHWPDMPPLLDMVRSISLTLVNDHLTAGHSLPRTPNLVPVGGVHIQPPGQLPDDLQRFMDEAKHGVILFSLGTYVPDHLQTKEYFEMYLGTFSKLRQRVIWKTKKTNLNVPENVLVRTWLPQQEILAHPRCVLFVTHGGQHSLLETVHYGVPVVTIPQFYDQFHNAMFFETEGVGIKLDEEDITQESLYLSITTVVNNKRYSRNMARLSAVFRDRPQSATQSVVYWAEYVIRHAGAHHLRPVAATMPWYQRASIDVAAVFVLVIVSIVLSIYIVVKIFLASLKTKHQKNVIYKKKTK